MRTSDFGVGVGDGQSSGIDLEQRQHARLIGRHDARDEPVASARDGHHDRRRLLGEVECTRNYVAVGIDNQAGRRADAFAEAHAAAAPHPNHFGAAGRFDLHDGRRDALTGRLERLLGGVVEGVGGLSRERDVAKRDASDECNE